MTSFHAALLSRSTADCASKGSAHDRQPLARVPVRRQHRGRLVVSLDHKPVDVAVSVASRAWMAKSSMSKTSTLGPDGSVVGDLGRVVPRLEHHRRVEVGGPGPHPGRVGVTPGDLVGEELLQELDMGQVVGALRGRSCSGLAACRCAVPERR